MTRGLLIVISGASGTGKGQRDVASKKKNFLSEKIR